MIEIKVKIHDKFSFEFKTSFIINQDTIDKRGIKEFSINTWMFLPNSLDINRSTYSKEQFYRDTKSNVRLITPVFSIEDIYTKKEGPISLLKDAFKQLADDPFSELNQENFAYQIRMFSCIFKSATRDEAYSIIECQDDNKVVKRIYKYVSDITAIIRNYRQLKVIINNIDIPQEVRENYTFGDEFIGNILEQQTFRILRGIRHRKIFNETKNSLSHLINEEIKHKKKKRYSTLDKENTTNNHLVIMRRGILKKIIESDLYLNTKKTKDGALVEQFFYGIAAGISMIFATIIAFTAQFHYGNFTVPLFFALVVSYIFKDRIKDLMRYYFSTQLGKKYFDTKRELETRNQNIGFTKEAFDFVSEDKTPPEVLNIRKRTPLVEAENSIYNEKIILYKKLVNLTPQKINQGGSYTFNGINDITRFNITHYTQKADDPFVSLYLPDEEKGYSSFKGEKVYSLHFVIRCESKNKLYYRKFRLLFNREGIKEIREIND